ncbi:MAG: histidine phosphatase family protein [Coriobacteriia bacterium]
MPGTVTEIAIIRHPETIANVEGRFVGRGDSEITQDGREQMIALTALMDQFGPSAVFASPLKRALITAQAITACGIPVNVLEDLQEIDFGRAEGLTYAEITAVGMTVDYLRNGSASNGATPADLAGPGDGPVAPGGELWSAFEARVARAALAVEGSGPRVAVVTHGGVFRTLLAHWLGLPMDASWRFAVPNATIATLRVTDGAGVLTTLMPAMA